MRNVTLIGFCLLLLVVQSSLVQALIRPPMEPQLMLPVVIYMGVSQHMRIVRGATLSFVAGYLLDLFCGSPLGLQTFVLVASFLIARAARVRILLRGPLFQMGITFVFGLMAGAVVLAIRTIFEKAAFVPMPSAWSLSVQLLGSAAATALVAPFLFLIVRRMEERHLVAV